MLVLVLLTATSAVDSATALGVRSGGTTDFCSTLNVRADAAQNRFKKLRRQVSSAWDSQDTRWAGLNKQFSEQVQAARDKIDDQRQLNFAKLEDRADTDAQRSAVSTYESVVTGAANTRRSAVDAARATYRDAAEAAIKARRANLSNQASGLSSAVSVAYATAEASCQGGVDMTTVRTTLLESLKTSRQTFAEQRDNDDAIRDQLASYVKTRNATIKAADKAFVQTVQDAATDLKAAFGSDV